MQLLLSLVALKYTIEILFSIASSFIATCRLLGIWPSISQNALGSALYVAALDRIDLVIFAACVDFAAFSI